MASSSDGDEHRPSGSRQMGLEVAGNLAAGVVGGLAGYAVAGPGGGMVAAAAGPAVTTFFKAAADHLLRRVSPQETARVNAFVAYAQRRVERNLAAGLRLREDGWFVPPRDGGRAAADEVADETARIVREQAQERKVQYLGNLIGNLAFAEDVGPVTAHRTVKWAEELTYTQYQLLALYYAHPDLLPRSPKDREGEISWESESVYGELDDIGFAKLELVLVATGKLLGPVSERKLSARGELLARLLSLDEIPVDELEEVVAPLTAGAVALASGAEPGAAAEGGGDLT